MTLLGGVQMPLGSNHAEQAAQTMPPADFPKLSQPRANSMLTELLSAYTAKKFQRKLQGLVDKAGGDSLELEDVPGRWDLARQVQTEVCPRYGFAHDEATMMQITSVLESLLHLYPELSDKAGMIYRALRVPESKEGSQQSQSKPPVAEPDVVVVKPQLKKLASSLSTASTSASTASYQRSSTTASLQRSSTTLSWTEEPVLQELVLQLEESSSPESQAGGARLSKRRALALQAELFSAFTSAGFQKKLHQLARSHGPAARFSPVYRSAFRDLVRSIQLPIIPKYGFDPTEYGVEEMMAAFQSLHDDPDVFVNSVAIREALFMPSSTDEKQEEQDPTKPRVPICNSKKAVLNLLKEQAVVFSCPAVQTMVAKLKKEADKREGTKRSEEAPDGYYHLPGRAELALELQRYLLPRHGFEGSRKGVRDMIQHCSTFIHDQEVASLYDTINSKLGMSPAACLRFRELATGVASSQVPKQAASNQGYYNLVNARLGSCLANCTRFTMPVA
mmetsp:Transcript_61947/g.100189  ORF Transcript_61947/g.100189 Transcript_61947/m.100189 type:complete len:505 (-) Transcript_61947:278-1792(-)